MRTNADNIRTNAYDIHNNTNSIAALSDQVNILLINAGFIPCLSDCRIETDPTGPIDFATTSVIFGRECTGPIPTLLGKLSNQESLSVSGASRLTGAIPTELGELSSRVGFFLFDASCLASSSNRGTDIG